MSDRQSVTYRLRGHNPDGPFVVEQNAFLAERDGAIEWLRVLCSGFRPGLNDSRAKRTAQFFGQMDKA